jgi:hypothetical protein
MPKNKQTHDSENHLINIKNFETSVRETQHELIKFSKESVDSFGIMRPDNQSPLIKFNLK